MAHLTILPPEVLAKLEQVATQGLRALIDKFLPARTGGFLYVQDAEGDCLFHGLIGSGDSDPARTEKWRAFSKEKAERLAAHPEHWRSYQSRDPSNSKWGGAIRLKNGTIISFSGLPEWADEILCAVVAYKMERATRYALMESPVVLWGREKFDYTCKAISIS